MRFETSVADMCQCAGCFESRQAVIKSRRNIALKMAGGLAESKVESLGRKLTGEELRDILKSVGFKFDDQLP